MRILHLTTQLPSAFGQNGGTLRQFELCRRAAMAGHEVTVVSPVSPAMYEKYRPVEQFASDGIRLVATRRRNRRESEALSALWRRPSLSLRALVAPYYGLQSEMLLIDMEPAIEAELARQPDIVTVDHDFAICLGDGISGVPKVLMTHNVTSDYYASRARSASGPWRLLLDAEARRMAAYTNSRLEGFDGIVAVSSEDAARLESITDTDVFIVPNGTAIQRVADEVQEGHAPELLFTGTMTHAPNEEGVLWFVSEVWPKIKQDVPAARLSIVGRRPSPRLVSMNFEFENIEVTGEVPDMSPYFERATAVVVPLRSGGGTRLKIMDAFGAGRPVLSTTLGAEGIEAKDEVHLLLADTPDAFAGKAVNLLADAQLRRQLVSNAARLVEEKYHWSVIADDYLAALDAVLVAETAKTSAVS